MLKQKTLTTLVAKPEIPDRTQAILTILSGVETGRVVKILPTKPFSLGRGQSNDCRFDDASVSGHHARILKLVGQYVLADHTSTNGTFVNGTRVGIEGAALKDGDRIQLGSASFLRFSYVDEDEFNALSAMYDAAFKDALTGVVNRKHLDERIDSELAFALRHGTELSLIIADIDHFKRINDTHGHLAGDAVLKATATILAKQLRVEDVLARYGGEEFIVLTRGISIANAAFLGERLRHAVAEQRTTYGGIELQVTISQGAASLVCCGDQRDKATLIGTADKRLYRAKQGGRNRVIVTG